MRLSTEIALAGLFTLSASAAMAQDAPRWTGFYAGGDVGMTNGDSSARMGTAPCHVGCGTAGSVDTHIGYGSSLGSGIVGGVEGDVGTSGR